MTGPLIPGELRIPGIDSSLGSRFGRPEELIGPGLILRSRILGIAVRLYLAANVFQTFAFDSLGVPFWLTH